MQLISTPKINSDPAVTFNLVNEVQAGRVADKSVIVVIAEDGTNSLDAYMKLQLR